MTDQTPPSTPPGWYPDGSGGQRYWDGTQWTGDAAPAGPAAPAQSNASSDGDKWWHNPVVVGLLLLCCSPVGLLLTWLHPKWSTKTKAIITAVLVGLIAIGAASGAFQDVDTGTLSSTPETEEPDESEPDDAAEPEPKAEPKAAPKEPDVSANAVDIIKEFEDNELSADAKYKGKVIAVTGVVSKIDTEPFDSNDYMLRVNGGTDFEFLTVDCYDIPNQVLSSVSVGDNVTMIGDFKDGGDLGVTLNHCRLR